MKKHIVQLMVLLVVIVGAASCTTSRTSGNGSRYPGSYPGVIFPGSRTSTQGMPPGQAKKVYGDQSAKKYAPGQQKKYNNGNNAGNGNGKGKNKGKKGKKH